MRLRSINVLRASVPPAALVITPTVAIGLAQILAGVGIACAACVDPSDAMSAIGFAGGLAGVGAAAAGAAAGTGETGGVAVDRDARTFAPPVGTAAHKSFMRNVFYSRYPKKPPSEWNLWMLRQSERLQKWAEDVVGTDVKGTAPASKA